MTRDRNLRQEVFGVGGDGWCVNQNVVGDESMSHRSLPRRERGKNERCEGAFSQPLTSARHARQNLKRAARPGSVSRTGSPDFALQLGQPLKVRGAGLLIRPLTFSA
jgi:hypothetical protein